MNYDWLLTTHGLIRWLVLFAGLLAVASAWCGKKNNQFTTRDSILASLFVGLLDLQFLIGGALYGISPLRQAAFADPAAALHNEAGFFAFLHPLLLIIAIAVAHIGKVLSKRAATPEARQSRILLYFIISLVLIGLGTPWWRPLLRLSL